MQPACGVEIIGKAQGRQFVHLGREDIGCHRNDPGAAQHTDGGRLVIIAGPDSKISRAEVSGLLYLAEISAGFLDADDVGMPGQLRIGFRQNIDPGAGGNVIKDDRRRDRIRNGLVQ